MHNVHYQLNLVRRAREAIVQGRFPEFLRGYWRGLYDGEKEKYPIWAVDALREVGVDLLAD
jgi:queuine tRNA-ribosyltransferase